MGAPIIHITGTDTGIGKTTIAASLVAALVARGIFPWVMKPVETGCAENGSGELFPSDAAMLRAAAGSRQSLDEVILYRFASPVAPVVAAELEHRSIDYHRIARTLSEAKERAPLVIYEGAGGILVPLTREKSFLDLADEVEAESIVVVGSRLGAVNHAALTFRAIVTAGLPCHGYVFNDLFAEVAPEEAAVPLSADALRTNRGLIANVAAEYGFRELAAVPPLREPLEGEQHAAPLADFLIRHYELRSHDAR